jgi:transcriptional regulator with XRE-family HTH domain
MNPATQRALEAAGWRFGDAADFLGMSDEERQLLDARVEAALAVRRQRAAMKLSQKQLASRIKTSQPRVAKIERAASDVSLDQILRAFAAAGGRITVKQTIPAAKARSAKPTRSKKTTRPSGAKVEIELSGADS